MKKFKIHKDDRVMVIAGRDVGKIGKVLKVFRKKDRVLVEKVNMVKRHTKANPHLQQAGGIIEKESSIHISNVALMCGACTKPTRVGYRILEGTRKVRFCKKCNEAID